MSYKRVLTIQDISCVGQCSMTVALPILSACGQETCVLPSAVLSNHTGGFSGFTFRDLTEDIPSIWHQWREDGISFDAIYTGYLGSKRQISYVKELIEGMKGDTCITVVDPAMADNGKLYTGFDEAYARSMSALCAQADIMIPNITEGCMMTGHPWKTEYNESYIEQLLDRLGAMGKGCVVLTGVSFTPDATGVAVWRHGSMQYYSHPKIAKSYHGTGDIFASAFVGGLMQGKDISEAARIAADFTSLCIRKTHEDPAHWYGVKFESALPELMAMLGIAVQ